MQTDRDVTAISTWDRDDAPDPNASGPGHPYRCTVCAWNGRGASAADHYRRTGHDVRGRDWPASWPHAQFSTHPLVRVCAWCQDADEQTAAARAHGLDVTHGICETHRAEFEAGR